MNSIKCYCGLSSQISRYLNKPLRTFFLHSLQNPEWLRQERKKDVAQIAHDIIESISNLEACNYYAREEKHKALFGLVLNFRKCVFIGFHKN